MKLFYPYHLKNSRNKYIQLTNTQQYMKIMILVIIEKRMLFNSKRLPPHTTPEFHLNTE